MISDGATRVLQAISNISTIIAFTVLSITEKQLKPELRDVLELLEASELDTYDLFDWGMSPSCDLHRPAYLRSYKIASNTDGWFRTGH